jgi:hypothetical protein
MALRTIVIASVMGGVVALTGCGASDGSVTDNGTDQSTDNLGKKHYHYEPVVEDVHFNGGCGIYKPNQDCTYGFVLRYTPEYIDLKTTLSHQTDNGAKTIDVTVDTWSYSQIHPMVAVGPENLDLGTLDAKVGSTYKVTVHDRKGVSLWSGKVSFLYHL